ncbi:inner centromere protein isoform X2 [Rhinatrema bivittatum]|uniref:inner centromere protein isoform X2 n=1 Tax=Rhinatrema bivittatum TaxID=194408 RepID=UPI00112B6FFE|nr:inner centromere protein isoform X2 [Rhinatrema bivittatum]
MVDTTGPSHLLLVCARKLDEFDWEVENKHLVWLQEIEEEARRMFSSDFNAEPELMPKTPSQKKRRKKKRGSVPDEDRELTGRRLSRKRKSSNWATSVRRLSTKLQKREAEDSIIEEEARAKRVTRARAQAQMTCSVIEQAPQEPLIIPVDDSDPVVAISASDRRSAEEHLRTEVIVISSEEEATKRVHVLKSLYTEMATVVVPDTPEVKGRGVSKVKLAHTSTPKQEEMEMTVEKRLDLSTEGQLDGKGPETEQRQDLSHHKGTPTGSKSDRRSVRRSLVGRVSKTRRVSLVDQYSLASKRDSMTREAVRKSMRKSLSKKRAAMESSSASSCVSYHSSIEMVDDEDVGRVRPETIPAALEDEVSKSPRRSLRLRSARKIAISNLIIEPELRRVTRQTLAQEEKTREQSKENEDPEERTQTARRESYKRAVDEQYDCLDGKVENAEGSPLKKTPSPPCPANKVVRPPPHMRGFLHTVQKNQLLMMTPSSIGRNIVTKSFIKRNTPVKVDPKEKERQRQENLRKKQEAELVRKQKLEEEKKRKLDELKVRREERLRKVLQARERVEQLEEEKKKKIEQKFAQIDEKNEKVREDRIAKEKAKKKATAKIMEEVELRRRQEEEARKQKLQQMEEEERKHQEMIQKKEEEQERLRKIAEAKKQAEQEIQQEREQQLAAERELERRKELERIQAERERERQEKERALQLQRELQRAAHEKAVAQERERLQKEMAERKRKEQERQEQEKKAKEKQLAETFNVTVDVENSPAVLESYQMTPQGLKPKVPKICDEDYGMDLNSDDSTDDESQPRKPIPAWATGKLLNEALRHNYYNPIDIDSRFGRIETPNLEEMFNKSKPRYFKRTSSAVWHSPPLTSNRINLPLPYGLKKY